MNVSKQLGTTATEDAVSMYLSFDESMSNVSYKSTATSTFNLDTSAQSGKDDSTGNKTLEPQVDDDFMDTMKDALETSELSSGLASVKFQPMRVVCEFKALSSTPSKKDEGHGDHTRKSGKLGCQSAKRKSNLSGVLDDLITKFEKSLNSDNDQDKENKVILSDISMPSFSRTSILELQKANTKLATIRNEKQKTKSENVVSNSIEKSKKHIPAVKKKVKMHTVARKTLCEPNLQTNRPSRIVPNNKSRHSYMNNGEAVNVGGTMWPIYRSNRFHRSEDDNPLVMVNEAVTPSEETVEIVGEKLMVKPFHHSLKPKAAHFGRKSILPSVSSDIRCAPRRMSTLVKTTLNSSTRKVPRKSIIGDSNTAISKRRSVLLLQNKLASPLLIRKKGSHRSSHASSSDIYIPTARAAGGGDVAKRSPRSQSAAARRIMQLENHDVKYTCSECGAFYNVRSLLDAHKRTHHVTSPETIKMRPQTIGGTLAINGTGINNTTNNRCRYCDKVFAIERALHIHLLEHCPKIPAADRRKLDFKEMDHVAKAETPHFRQGSTRPHKKTPHTLIDGNKDPLLNFPVKKYQEKTSNDYELVNKSKKDNIVKKDEKNTPSNANGKPVKSQMGPPTTSKIKKKTAHAGVYRTPNKDIPCLSCKQSFKNVMDYTNHMMLVHKSLDSSNSSVNTSKD